MVGDAGEVAIGRHHHIGQSNLRTRDRQAVGRQPPGRDHRCLRNTPPTRARRRGAGPTGADDPPTANERAVGPTSETERTAQPLAVDPVDRRTGDRQQPVHDQERNRHPEPHPRRTEQPPRRWRRRSPPCRPRSRRRKEQEATQFGKPSGQTSGDRFGGHPPHRPDDTGDRGRSHEAARALAVPRSGTDRRRPSGAARRSVRPPAPRPARPDRPPPARAKPGGTTATPRWPAPRPRGPSRSRRAATTRPADPTDRARPRVDETRAARRRCRSPSRAARPAHRPAPPTRPRSTARTQWPPPPTARGRRDRCAGTDADPSGCRGSVRTTSR